MSSDFLSSPAPLAPLAPTSASEAIPASSKLILKLLSKLRHGALTLTTPSGRVLHYGEAVASEAPVTLELKTWNVFSQALRSGDIGFAETYIEGQWSTNNLTGLIALLARNRAAIEELVYGSWWGRLVYRVRHLMNRNSRAGSRRNISDHYDIGNEFYKLWLDGSMTYSSALYTEAANGDLALAQTEKYRAILGELNVKAGDTVLEIGCGWGGFAEIAARDAAVHVTGLTLSHEQLAYARQRLADAGLESRTDLRLCDYRDSAGQYDAIASIEMFEAVGESYWPSYFACVARNLKPGGRACVQTIVIADELFARYREGTDFIQQYIFPGGMLPSPSKFRALAAQHGLSVTAERRFGIDYADTLQAWRRAFHARLAEVRAQGFDERFIRTWEFYLCYCEAAFREHNTDVMHFTLAKA